MARKKLKKALRKFGYDYAKQIGIATGDENNRCYFETEGLSRYIADRIMEREFPWLPRNHREQTSKYDEDVFSGETRIKLEMKVRYVSSTTYPDSKITDSKCDFESNQDWWLVVFYWDDCKWYIWDMSEYTPEYEGDSWGHSYSSSDFEDDRWVEDQDAWVFDFSKAKYSGELERRTIKYARERGYGA